MIKRFLLALAWVAVSAAAQEPPLKVLPDGQADLGPAMWVHKVSPGAELVPELLWDQPEPADAHKGSVATDPFATTVGRVRLVLPDGGPERYVLQVPSTRLDRVRLWYRVEGGAWVMETWLSRIRR